ncbi:FtsX-like permease family protein [Nonomuraea sp. LPB2021202275-12-8]|uniref:FtsX-like permease family protein n=1 Tax=Nonomuraea sp. LPB2021202275-12-8 TaxID=3120159 RepID=UPI00300C9F45
MKLLLLARVHLGAVAVLMLLTLSACLLVSGLPRVMQAAFDQALRQSLSSAPAVRVDLTAVLASSGAAQDLRERAQFEAQDEQLRELVPAPLKNLVPPPGTGTGHASAKTYKTPVHESGGWTFINLGWLSDSDRRVDWVEGRAPGEPTQMRWRGMTIPLFEVGIVGEARDLMHLQLGDTKIIGESNYAAVKIVGIFRAKDAADSYWTHNSDILHVRQVVPPGKLDSEWYTTALIPDAGLSALSGDDRNLSYQWVLPIHHRSAAALDVPELASGVNEFERRMKLQPGIFAGSTLMTGLPTVLGHFLTALATAQTVMFLVLGGLLLVALGVIVLAVQLLIDRMDHGLSLTRARGGSLRQVAGTGAGLVALAVAPAAVTGYALSYLFPGPVLPIVHLGPAAVIGTALAFAAARIAVTHRAPLHERRDDVVAARPSVRRITLELLVVGLALAGAYLLRTRGLTTQVAQEGQDPFLLLVPLALTLAAALITIRCYPYPLRLFVRLAARMRPAVPFLGLTRAARARSFSVLPVLILLPALGVSVFASVISDGVAGTQRLAAWQSVGAPFKISSERELTAEVVERVRQVPGVRRVVPAQTATVQVGHTPERAQIIAVDLARWRKLLAGTPISLPALPATASGIPALVSHELRGRGTFEIGWQSRLRITTQGVIPAVPGFFTQGKFIVVPFDVNQRPAVNTLLIDGNATPAALAQAAPHAKVESRAGALAAIQDDPLTSTVRDTLLVVTVALASYALIAVVITLVIGAADRARALSFLRTLGLSDRQAQRLTVLEILPMILVTALVGLALGLGLPAALGPGVDLSSYAGGLSVGDYELDLITPAALAAGLAAVAVLGAYAHTAISRRRSLGAVLRVGDLA